jgi:hypothetical protein
MAIRHPSEFFIKYLVSLPRNEANDDQWIVTNLTALGYPQAEWAYIQELRISTLQDRPADFRPQDRYHRESVKYLRSHGIWSIYNQDDAMKEATVLITDLKSRQLIEQLLLSGMEPKEVAKKANAKLSKHFTVPGIESYRHYYWNTTICALSDWERIFRHYDPTTQSKALSIVKVGPAMALHQTGFSQHIESKNILKDMLTAVYFDFKDWQAQPFSENRTKAFAGLAKTAVIIDQQLAQADNALRESLKAFEQFRMQHNSTDITGVRDLAPGGNYSLSGARLLESGEPQDEQEEVGD